MGPNVRDEAGHLNDPLHFTPATTPSVAGTPAQPAVYHPMAAGIQTAYNGGGLQKEVFGFAPYWALSQHSSWNYSLLSTVAYFGITVKWDGNFETADAGSIGFYSQDMIDMVNEAHRAGDRVVLVIKGSGTAAINDVVTVPSETQLVISNTINAIGFRNLDGVNVDFEGATDPIYPNIQSGLTNFMTQMSAQVHQHWPNAFVSIDTYTGSASWDGGLMNIGALAPVVDAMFIMAYDMSFSNMPGQAGPNAPMTGWTFNDATSISEYLTKAPASKIILGVPWYGYRFNTRSNTVYAPTSDATAESYARVLTYLSCAPGVAQGWDATGQSPGATWYSPSSGDPCGKNLGSWQMLYYDDVRSLGLKYDLVNASGIRGMGIWALGYDGGAPELWSELSTYFSCPVTVSLPASQTTTEFSVGLSAGSCSVASFDVQQYDSTLNSGWYPIKAGPPSGGLGTAVAEGFPGSSYQLRARAHSAAGVVGAWSMASTTVASTATWARRGTYQALPPARILDTRNGTGGVPVAPLGPGGTLSLQIAGQNGVPPVGASAVVLNVTATNTTASSYLTVWPADVARPLASSLNWVSGQTRPNLVEMALGLNGQLSFYNGAGSADVIVDVAGYVAKLTATPPAGGLYTPVVPSRVLDTRTGNGAAQASVGQNQTITVQVAGRPGSNVPATGVSAVVLNVAVTNPTSASYLTVFPAGTSRPLASNLNFVAKETVPNRVIVKVGMGGAVSFYNGVGSVDVVADVGGWFTDGTVPVSAGSPFVGVTPARILDTRDGTGGVPIAPLSANATMVVSVAGRGRVPTMTATTPPTAVVLNVTVTGSTAPSYLTVWPDGSAQPLASDLNWVSGQTVPNLVIVKLGGNGSIDLFNGPGFVNVIIDVVGWYG